VNCGPWANASQPLRHLLLLPPKRLKGLLAGNLVCPYASLGQVQCGGLNSKAYNLSA
jgi:hypothetical protein